MKTYKEVVEKPRLVICYDEGAVSPREDSNLGYFITCDSKYSSPDKNERLENIISNSGEIARDLKEHIRLIKDNYNNIEDKIIGIYPICKYEHSGVVYSLRQNFGFDYSNNGFYIITEETQKEVGVEKNNWKKVIELELEEYNQWASGDIFRFTLYDKEGKIEDSCGGFYNIEDIRENLPKEWEKEDLEKYLID